MNELIEKFGVTLHIVMNEKEDIDRERNPYCREERIEMFRVALPEYGDRLHFTTVYLDRGGDCGDAVRALSAVFGKFSDPERATIFYVNKPEDVKTYRLDGVDYSGIHYTDLFLPPFGSFAKQELLPSGIAALPKSVTEGLLTYVEGLKPALPIQPTGRVVRARGIGL